MASRARSFGLSAFFAESTAFAGSSTRDWVARIQRHQNRLDASGRRFVFFGVFKAGKSTLLNALIGSDLLPARTLRATGLVTEIVHHATPQARLLEVNGAG